MNCLDLNKVTCRICITGDESVNGLSNLFTKTIKETVAGANKFINDDSVLNMPLSDALVSFTCVELQRDHGLPETVCRKCECQLIETLAFIHRTNATQGILNSHAARSNQNTKVKIEEIEINEASSYVIEELNNEGEVIQDEYRNKLSSVEPISDINDCDEEYGDDSVLFIKNIKRARVVYDPSESVRPDAARKSFSFTAHFECTYCQKSFFQSENLKSHLRTHVKKNVSTANANSPDQANVVEMLRNKLSKVRGAEEAHISKIEDDFYVVCGCKKRFKVIGQRRGKKNRINWTIQPFQRHWAKH